MLARPVSAWNDPRVLRGRQQPGVAWCGDTRRLDHGGGRRPAVHARGESVPADAGDDQRRQRGRADSGQPRAQLPGAAEQGVHAGRREHQQRQAGVLEHAPVAERRRHVVGIPGREQQLDRIQRRQREQGGRHGQPLRPATEQHGRQAQQPQRQQRQHQRAAAGRQRGGRRVEVARGRHRWGVEATMGLRDRRLLETEQSRGGVVAAVDVPVGRAGGALEPEVTACQHERHRRDRDPACRRGDAPAGDRPPAAAADGRSQGVAHHQRGDPDHRHKVRQRRRADQRARRDRPGQAGAGVAAQQRHGQHQRRQHAHAAAVLGLEEGQLVNDVRIEHEAPRPRMVGQRQQRQGGGAPAQAQLPAQREHAGGEPHRRDPERRRHGGERVVAKHEREPGVEGVGTQLADRGGMQRSPLEHR